jgi:5'-3' exonuclease
MKIAAVDLSAIYHPIWHIKAEDGAEVYRATLAKVARLVEGYDRVAICVDAGDSGRKAINPDYKANRDVLPEAFRVNLERTVDALDRDGYHIMRCDGFEADDVIATIYEWYALRYRSGKSDILDIIGTDKDLLQLSLIDNSESGEVMSPDEKLGVHMDNVPYYLALVGDSADNIKGAPGIGPKGAAKLLNEHIWDDIIGGKVGTPAQQKSIEENRDQILQALELVTLKRDLPIDCSVLLEEKPIRPRKEGEQEDYSQPPTPEEPKQETAIAVPKAPKVEVMSANWERELEPRSGSDAYAMSKALFNSNFFRQHGSQNGVFAVIVSGREFGLGAMASLRGFHIIEGKPAMSAQLMAGLVLRSGLAEYFEPDEGNNERSATWITKRKGRPEKRRTFTIQDADRAGLTKPTRNGKPSNFVKYPSVMLDMRACSMLARVIYPDVLGNVYSLADFDSDSAVVEAAIANEER